MGWLLGLLALGGTAVVAAYASTGGGSQTPANSNASATPKVQPASGGANPLSNCGGDTSLTPGLMSPITLSASGSGGPASVRYCAQGGMVTSMSSAPQGIQGGFTSNRAQIFAAGVSPGLYAVGIFWTDGNGAAQSTIVTTQVIA